MAVRTGILMWLKHKTGWLGGQQPSTRLPEFSSLIARGDAALASGTLEQATHIYEQAVGLNPGDAALRVVIGAVLIRQKKYGTAKAHLNRAILLDSGNVYGHYLLGKVEQVRENFSVGIEHFKDAIDIKPDFESAIIDLAWAYLHHGQQANARQTLLDGALQLPMSAQIQWRLGTIYADTNNFEQALECYDKALVISPAFSEAHWFRAQALQQRGEIEPAVRSAREALRIDPDFFAAHSTLLWMLSFHSDCPADQYLAEARRFGTRVQARAKPLVTPVLHHRRAAASRLRIGLVSGDFKIHPVGYFLEGLLNALDPARLELIAYSMNLQDDELTARIRGNFAGWTSLTGVSDEDAARMIHADGVDILIDLAGHSAYNRLPVFAWKPAPIQVSWLGYLASTGVPGMDYVIADAVAAPESVQDQFSETIWRLPETFNCFTPPPAQPALAVAASPALAAGYVTFGSFQRLNKFGGRTLSLWKKVLDALPPAKLCLRNGVLDDPEQRALMLERLSRAGIARGRVILEGAIRERASFLATYAQVDIVLDTPEYPGTTTTCEALWMGVPTLTLAGATLLERVGASLLTCAGLSDWVAWSEQEYVELAVKHATDIDELARLRAGLRQQVATTALFDAHRFAVQFEDAMFAIWERKMPCSPG